MLQPEYAEAAMDIPNDLSARGMWVVFSAMSIAVPESAHAEAQLRSAVSDVQVWWDALMRWELHGDPGVPSR